MPDHLYEPVPDPLPVTTTELDWADATGGIWPTGSGSATTGRTPTATATATATATGCTSAAAPGRTLTSTP